MQEFNLHITQVSPTMILELADIQVTPDHADTFADRVAEGIRTVVSRATGFQGYKLNRSIETPQRYVLMIYWLTLENHTVDFRQGPLFSEWRAIVGPAFAAPPHVEHFNLMGKSA